MIYGTSLVGNFLSARFFVGKAPQKSTKGFAIQYCKEDAEDRIARNFLGVHTLIHTHWDTYTDICSFNCLSLVFDACIHFLITTRIFD